MPKMNESSFQPPAWLETIWQTVDVRNVQRTLSVVTELLLVRPVLMINYQILDQHPSTLVDLVCHMAFSSNSIVFKSCIRKHFQNSRWKKFNRKIKIHLHKSEMKKSYSNWKTLNQRIKILYPSSSQVFGLCCLKWKHRNYHQNYLSVVQDMIRKPMP